MPSPVHVGPDKDIWSAASWIGGNFTLVRTDFKVASASDRTLVYISVVGFFQVWCGVVWCGVASSHRQLPRRLNHLPRLQRPLSLLNGRTAAPI